MNILVLFTVVGVCLADKLPSSRSGYSFNQPSPAFNIRPRPAPQPIYSAPRQTHRPTFSAPRQPTFSSPQATYSAPRQPTFSSPQATYSAPRQPTFSSPQATYSAPHNRVVAKPVVPILRDDRVHPVAGAYSFMLETGDGVTRQETGSPVYSKEGPVSAVTGSYSFTLPDGQLFELHYIADENGFQPQSSFLPVAPAFPHPIPAHALEQIERGRREHEARARGEIRQQPSQFYSSPSRPQRPSNIYGAPN